MEIKKISDELERIVESKRIPNALIFETDGLNSELEMSLEFAKKILLSNEQNPVNQNKIVKDLYTLFHIQIYTSSFQYQSQTIKKRIFMITIIKPGLKWR